MNKMQMTITKEKKITACEKKQQRSFNSSSAGQHAI